jgi:hypothetical protein
MFMSLKHVFQRLTILEKTLVAIAVVATIAGFFYINKLYTGEGRLSWALLQGAFLWMILLFLMILTETNNKIKEELKEVVKQHIKETQVLQDVSNKQLAELRAMRREFNSRRH